MQYIDKLFYILQLLVFFLFLGVCSLGCCCSSCWYREQNEKSRRTFVAYFRKFGSFRGGKTGGASTQAAESVPESGPEAASERRASAWSIATQQEGSSMARHSSSHHAHSPYSFKAPTLFGLNLGNERRMKECEPEHEDDHDDGNMRFLSSMLKQHHSRTNNMLASALFPFPVPTPQQSLPPPRSTNNRSFLPSLPRFGGSRQSGKSSRLFTIKEKGAKDGREDV